MTVDDWRARYGHLNAETDRLRAEVERLRARLAAVEAERDAAHFRALVPDANGLLPCPMCGPHGKPTITGTFQGDFNVICKTCSLRTVYHMEKADAIAAWNRRGGIAAVVKPPSGQHVLGYIDFLEAWVVVHCDDAGMWRCAWDGEQLCDDVTYWQELPADPERKKQEDDDA